MNMLKHLVGILLIVMGARTGQALEIYRLGDEEHPWEESWETSGETSLIDMTDGVIAPILADPDRNLSLGLLDRGGLISPEGDGADMGFEDLTKMHSLIDGDSTTTFVRYIDLEHVGDIWRDLIRIDLGGRYPVNRIVFYPRPGYENRQIAWFRLYVNDGINLNPAEEPIWQLIREETEESDVTVVTEFGTRPLRYVGFRPYNPTRTWEIAEIEIYGEGYVSDASYTSDIIDFGAVSSWGKIRWAGERDKDGKVFIQTRTGIDEDPNIYWRRTGVGDEITNRRDDGEMMRARDYRNLPRLEQAGTTYDVENWSFWSASYDFELGLVGEDREGDGVYVISPGPRRYFQLRVDFRSAGTDGGWIDWLGFELSRPPAADAVVAEVWPLEVEPGTSSEFVYSMSPTIRGSNTGFNSLEIFTAVQPDGIDFVRIDDREVDLGEYVPELREDRLVVHFSRMGEESSGSLVEVGFRCMVLRYGTEFDGRVYDSESEEVALLVRSGDASDRYDGDELSVRTSLGEGLIRSVEVSSLVFSPNGDGVNDEVEIRWDVLKLTGEVPVGVGVYDLGGRRVREVYSELGKNGQYSVVWAGKDDDGVLVSPGIYVYRISVEADVESKVHSGSLALVY